MKTYTGYNCNTAKRLMLDAGVYFKNFKMGVDTYKTALQQGKCLGATKGGGNFVAVPTLRTIEVDGIKTVAKGMEAIDGWEATIQATVIEISAETIKLALGNGEIDSTSNEFYDIIRAKSTISEDDYLENITWVGTLSGSNEPVIIQIYNAINTTGMNMAPQDKNESSLSMTFKAHQDCSEDSNVQPFAIFYPKALAVAMVEDIETLTTEVKGTGLAGATIYVTGGTLTDVTATVSANGTWTATITPQVLNTIIYVTQVVKGRESDPITLRVTLEKPQIDDVLLDDVEISGTGIPGATVHVYDENYSIPAGTTTVVDKDNVWSVKVAKQEVDNVIYAIQYINGNVSLEATTVVAESEEVQA